MKKLISFFILLWGMVFLLPAFAQNSAGDIWFEPESLEVEIGSEFAIEMHANTGTKKLGAYGIDIDYDQLIISVETTVGENGVVAGTEGFVSAVNPVLGLIKISGFDANGTGPGENLHILTINFNADSQGTTALDIIVDQFLDQNEELPIGDPAGYSGKVIVFLCGDVNDDGEVNILDALRIAQYYVDLIDELNCCTSTPNPTPNAGVQETFTADGVSFNLSYVPGGYSFPTGVDDSGTTTVTKAYWIGETEVTYELWYKVYTWAESNGYTFANTGRPGHYGTAGTETTSQEPVTTINWRDSMVFCNALTEWYNANNGIEQDMTCVYYTDTSYTIPIRSCDNSIAINYPNPGGQDDPIVNTTADGFRLVTSEEWELAARWSNDSTNTVAGYSNPYFTKGDSASGAKANSANAEETGLVAWYIDNSEGTTHAVKTKQVNSLGLYDISGNVKEWCFDWHSSVIGSYRVYRGGSWYYNAYYLQVGVAYYISPYYEDGGVGFRFARTAK